MMSVERGRKLRKLGNSKAHPLPFDQQVIVSDLLI